MGRRFSNSLTRDFSESGLEASYLFAAPAKRGETN
jgi:hypothetical protein